LRIEVLGAGIVGLSVADELVRRGHDVVVVDPAPGRGASHAAAGMLSPAGELWHGESELFRLGRASVALWPDFAARLGVHVHRRGTLLVGLDAGDLQRVERQLELLAAHDVRVEPLERSGLRRWEPGLGRVAGGALLPDDHSVDPRAIVAALLDRVPVVPEPRGGAEVSVIATGARLPAPYAHLVRPVRGDVLRVRSADPMEGTVRGWVHGEQVYVVPRRPVDGVAEIVVGATSEERTGPPAPTVEGVARLLDSARRLLPGLDRAHLVEAIARDRPGTADNRPLIGPTGDAGVLLAAGHYRHGVLLAPLTAQLVADHLESGAVDPAVDPRRFRSSQESGSRSRPETDELSCDDDPPTPEGASR
jgi:glycine oxidase